MVTNPIHKTDAADGPDNAPDLKRKLLWRMLFTGIMILFLLGGLALFDSLPTSQQESNTEAEEFTKPVPVAKKIVGPVTAIATETASPPASTVLPSVEGSEPPRDRNAPVVEPEAVSLAPHKERAKDTLVLSQSPRSPTATRLTASPDREKPADAKPIPHVSSPANVESVKKEALAPETALVPVPSGSVKAGFSLQAGIFVDQASAEALQNRLLAAGIPASIESRVQVGPFKSRSEALRAQEKLKELGVAAKLLPRGLASGK